jgi:hypothetical protein
LVENTPALKTREKTSTLHNSPVRVAQVLWCWDPTMSIYPSRCVYRHWSSNLHTHWPEGPGNSPEPQNPKNRAVIGDLHAYNWVEAVWTILYMLFNLALSAYILGEAF